MTDRPTLQDLTDALAASALPITAHHTTWSLYVDELVRAHGADTAALLDRIAELEAELGHGDRATVFGTSRPHAVPGMIIPSAPLARVYVSDGKRPTSFGALNLEAQRACDSSTQAIILSWKEVPGAWLDELLADLRDRFPAHDLIGCQNHEPYDNFTTDAQVAEYHRRWSLALPIMEDQGWLSSTILDGSHPESWDRFDVDGVAYHGMDRYNPGIQQPKAYVDPDEVFGPYVEWLAGRPGLIAETGTGLVPGDAGGAGRFAWTADAHDYLDGKVAYAAWWSQGGCQLTQELLETWLTGELP